MCNSEVKSAAQRKRLVDQTIDCVILLILIDCPLHFTAKLKVDKWN